MFSDRCDLLLACVRGKIKRESKREGIMSFPRSILLVVAIAAFHVAPAAFAEDRPYVGTTTATFDGRQGTAYRMTLARRNSAGSGARRR